MSDINTEFLQKCLETLEKSYSMIKTAAEGTIDYEMYRNSLVKGFEMTLEQSGKLLRKKIAPYFASKKLPIHFPLRIYLGMRINFRF